MFEAGQLPKTNFFTVFEEVPGLFHYEDKTDFLISQTYWPSYNIPYYPDIFEISGIVYIYLSDNVLFAHYLMFNLHKGYTAVCSRNKDNCYDTAPRAYLFAEYHTEVTGIEGGKWILSHNDWVNDAASKNDACDAISCRGDLETKKV